MSEEFGAGIFLDEGLDFSVDTTGDLRSEDGIDELQKDIAFQMILSLQRFLGEPPSGNLEAKISNTVSNVLLADSRINSIVDGSIEVSYSGDRKRIDIAVTARTNSGKQILVFSV